MQSHKSKQTIGATCSAVQTPNNIGATVKCRWPVSGPGVRVWEATDLIGLDSVSAQFYNMPSGADPGFVEGGGGAAVTASATCAKVFGGSRLKTLFGISKGGGGARPLRAPSLNPLVAIKIQGVLIDPHCAKVQGHAELEIEKPRVKTLG